MLPARLIVTSTDGVHYVALDDNPDSWDIKNYAQGKASSFQGVCQYLENLGYEYLKKFSLERGETVFRKKIA